MVDIITCDKDLIFEAVNGMYDGRIISYNDHMEWLMWKDDNTYMVSQSGLPNYYNLYFAKYVDGIGNKSVHLSYHENDKKILQYADENHPTIEFDTIFDALAFVYNELRLVFIYDE